MDTKSKRFKFHIGFKILAWALCIASACSAVFLVREISNTEISNAVPEYADSLESVNELEAYVEDIRQAYFQPDDDTVRRETDAYVDTLNSLQAEELARVAELGSMEDVYQYYEALGEIAISGTGAITAYEDAATSAKDGTGNLQEAEATEAVQEIDPVSEYRIRRTEEIREYYAQLVGDAEQHVREEYEQTAEQARKRIERKADLVYAVVDAGVLADTNVEQANPLGYLWQSGAKTAMALSQEGDVQYYSGGANIDDLPAWYESDVKIYAAVSPDAYDARETEYNHRYGLFKQYFAWLICALVVFVAGFVWLMVTAGRQVDSDEVKIGAADAAYLDVGFLLMVAGIAILLLLAYMSNGSFYLFLYTPRLDAVGFFGMGATVAGIVSLILLWSTSLARRVKNGSAGTHTLFYKIFGGIHRLHMRAHATAQAVAVFVLYILAGLAAVIITVAGVASGAFFAVLVGLVLMLIYIILSLRYILKKARVVHDIEEGVEEIKGGNMEYVIPIEGDTPMGRIAGGVNNIAEGLSTAVKKEVKAERMKTELITNISHDLKTPLTSIMTYVDLLKKEPGLTANALKYIDVLDAKSNRLKILTDDLFEAAKASSGDMTVEMTHIELVQFMEQATGEMSDRMEASGLHFIGDIPEDPVYVHADGRLLFRVISNVFDNVIKYALDGSRVYMGVEQDAEHICLVVKNISKEALNITEEELTERFVRGDSSRNTEGSGLGLAIAKNFMQLMGGQFIIEIDGDLFKVKICLRRAA